MIKLTNVSKTYENNTRAIDDISLTLQDVGFVAITGTSGSGKSTLLNILSGNDFATAGLVEYDGKSYAEVKGDLFKKQFGYVYQDFKLIENLTAYQNIMIGHELASDKLSKDMVLDIAKKLEIDEVLDQKVYSLSGGQQQRVAIARTLARSPKVIFADEPTGNLDTQNSVNVLNILRRLATDKLVVVVSHDKSIAQWADRVITLCDGKIIDDAQGEGLSYVEPKESAKTSEEEDGEEILQLQAQVKSKKVAKVFSSNAQAKRLGNKAGLSAKSSLGLSVALLNKDIAKKICLMVVAVILIAFMTLSCAMTFATVEKTMAKAINSGGGKKTFAVKPIIYNPNKSSMDASDIEKFDSIIKDSGLNALTIATGEVIASDWGSLIISDNDAKKLAYYQGMSLENMQNAIFTDDASAVGIEILFGNAPIHNDEIAISKSYYDYMLEYKTFETEIKGQTHTVNFTKDNIINNKQIHDLFGVKICGVFDDKNTLDESLKDKDISTLTPSEADKINSIVSEELKTNPLVNLVVKCKKAEEDWNQFAGVNYKNQITMEGCFGFANFQYYFDFAPLTDVTQRYFDIPNLMSSLNGNEIAVKKETLDRINKYLERDEDNQQQVGIGSTISMSIVRMASINNVMHYPDLVYTTEEVTIAQVIDDENMIDSTIFMSKELYDNLSGVQRLSESRLIYGDKISASSLKKLNKGFNDYVQNELNLSSNCCVNYSIIGCPMTDANDYGFIFICQNYVCVPLMIATVAMAIGIIVVFYFDFVKTKAKDLLILKSLGAKPLDFVKIYGVFCLALICILLVVGLSIGSLLIALVSMFASSFNGYATSFAVFYLDAASVAFAIALVFFINVASLAISIARLNGKNLRKAFQKIKK